MPVKTVRLSASENALVETGLYGKIASVYAVLPNMSSDCVCQATTRPLNLQVSLVQRKCQEL
jgi:hypothetical protein